MERGRYYWHPRFQPLVCDKLNQTEMSIGMNDLVLLRGVIDDVKRRSQSQPNTSLELCWTDKLAELRAKLPPDGYERLIRLMKDPQPHDQLMDGHSWRLDPTSFPYSSIRVEPFKDALRLIILMPSTEKSSPIECTLAQDFLQNESPYEALSYVWGAVPGKSQIQVNKRPFLATKNLEAALRTLRLHNSARILWVDAICINQKDPQEKQRQVQMMSKVRIYTSFALFPTRRHRK